jgi:hypothetical protein
MISLIFINSPVKAMVLDLILKKQEKFKFPICQFFSIWWTIVKPWLCMIFLHVLYTQAMQLKYKQNKTVKPLYISHILFSKRLH